MIVKDRPITDGTELNADSQHDRGPGSSELNTDCEGFPSDVSLAVIAYNAHTTLPACIRGVLDSGCPIERIAVYDVASTDGSAHWLAEHYPQVRVVRLEENLGPNPARNLALSESKTPFVVVMDADVELLPGAVRGLRHAIGDDERVAVATPVVMYADRPEVVQYRRTFVHFLAEASAQVDDISLAQLRDETARVGLASGCAPLIRRSAAQDVGMFEERYFFGKTDGEFAYRITLGGWHIIEPATTQVLHHYHKRGNTYYMHQVRNRWHFMLKDYQLRTLLAVLPVLFVHEPALFLLLLIKGRAGDYFRALASLFVLLPSLPADRRRVARARRVHDWQVLRGDKLVIPGDVKRGALGGLISLYSAAIGIYWRVACGVLKLVSGRSEGPGIPAEGEAESVGRENQQEPGAGSQNNAA